MGLRKCVNEARALAKLGAVPSVVRVQDFFQENNTVYIVMEFVKGVTLNAWLKRRPRATKRRSRCWLPSARRWKRYTPAALSTGISARTTS